MFERENPGLKVEGLACNWLRREKSAFWVIERKPAELVKELLSTDYIFTDDGPVYLHRNPSVFGVADGGDIPSVGQEKSLIVPQNVVDAISSMLKKHDEIVANLDKMKTSLREAMEKCGIKSWDSGLFRATIMADSETVSFDVKRFKADHPDLYDRYSTKKIKKGGFTLKNKDK